MPESRSKKMAKETLERMGADDEEAEAVMSRFPDGSSRQEQRNHQTTHSDGGEIRDRKGIGLGQQVYSAALVILITAILKLEHSLEKLHMTRFNSSHYEDPLFRKVSYLGLFLSIISLFIAIVAFVGEEWAPSSYLIILFLITTVFFLHSSIAGVLRSAK